MSHATSIDAALAPRLALIAQAMAERVDPGAWAGYRAEEGLVTDLDRPSSLGGALTVSGHRPGNPDATVTLGFVEMVDVRDESTMAATLIEDGITEEEFLEFDIPAGVKTSKTVSHDFETTHSYSEALADTLKDAWEAGGKASLGFEYSGVKGAVEAFGKYGQEKTRQASSSSSESTRKRDTVSETFEVVGPAKFKLRAYRARKREQRILRARADFDGKVYWTTGESAWEFTTFRTQFLPIIRRTATSDIYGYREFREKPMSDEEIDRIEAFPDKLIEVPVPFDTIVSKSLVQVS